MEVERKGISRFVSGTVTLGEILSAAMSFFMFALGLGIIYSTMNSRIDRLETALVEYKAARIYERMIGVEQRSVSIAERQNELQQARKQDMEDIKGMFRELREDIKAKADR